MIKRYLLLDRGGAETLPGWLLLLGPALLLCQWVMRRTQIGERISGLRLEQFCLLYGCVWAVALALLPLGYRPFIYFQF